MRGVFLSVLGVRLVSAAAGLGLTLLLGRLLGAEGYGAYAFAMGWITLVLLVTTLGFPQYAVRAIPPMLVAGRADELRGFVLGSVALTGVLGLAAALALPRAVTWVEVSADPRLAAALAAAAVLVVPMALNQLRTGLMRGLGRPVAAQLPELVIQPLLLLALVAGAWGLGIALDAGTVLRLAALSAAVGLAVGLVPLLRALAARPAPRPAFRPGRWTGAALQTSAVFAAATALSATDMVMLGRLSTAAETGHYGIAARFFHLMYLPALAAAATLGAEASRLAALGRLDALSGLVRTTATRTALLTLGFALAATLVSFRLGWIFGPEFAAAQVPVLVLVWFRAVEAVFGHPSAVLTGAAFTARIPLMFAVAVLVNIGLNALMIPAWGATGAALATGASHLGLTLAVAVETRRRLGILSLPGR